MQNQNALIIQQLSILKSNSQDIYRARAFELAAREVQKINYSICDNLSQFQQDVEQKRIRGIGAGIMARITEYCETGQIKEVQQFAAKSRAIAEMTQIRGVGPTLATQWYNRGLHGLSDVRRALANNQLSDLTDAQKYGILYYSDLNTKIPRRDISTFAKNIEVQINKAVAPPLPIHFEVVGSYRRGADSSGDIDILLCYNKINNNVADAIIRAMMNCGWVATLSHGDRAMSFLCEIANHVRQCDILLCLPNEWVAALVYFTGSKDFGIRLRKMAKLRGMKLNQLGLWRNGRAIPLHSEAELFRQVGMPYIEPKNRI